MIAKSIASFLAAGVIVSFLLGSTNACIAVSTNEQQCTTSAYFAPVDNLQDTIVLFVVQAKQSLYISAFGITNQAIADALVAAKKRGVDVEVGLDRLQSESIHSKHQELLDAGILVFIKKTMLYEHNKYIIKDGDSVLVGSTNFSSGAMHQDNTSVVLKSCPVIVKEFQHDFARIKSRDL